jgi:hypothetical protein
LLRKIPDPFGIILNLGLVAGLVWLAVEIAQRLLGEKSWPVHRGAATAGKGLDGADLAVVLSAKDHLLRIRRAIPRITDATAVSALEELAKIADEHLASLADSPERLRRVRRPLSYHLPKAAELASGLAAIGRQPDHAARAARIEAVLVALADHFRAHRDGLAIPDSRSLDVEIRLLENALSGERTAQMAATLVQRER